MKCPVCDETLSVSSREGVEIDFCPQCRGVWLDRGELDKIVERVNATGGYERDDRRGDDRRRDDRYDDDRRRDDRYDDRSDPRRKKKRGGFLEDLFDFG